MHVCVFCVHACVIVCICMHMCVCWCECMCVCECVCVHWLLGFRHSPIQDIVRELKAEVASIEVGEN